MPLQEGIVNYGVLVYDSAAESILQKSEKVERGTLPAIFFSVFENFFPIAETNSVQSVLCSTLLMLEENFSISWN